MNKTILIRPKMCCNCGQTLFAEYDLFAHSKSVSVSGMDVYEVDLLDEAEGLTFRCIDCGEIYDIMYTDEAYHIRDKEE